LNLTSHLTADISTLELPRSSRSRDARRLDDARGSQGSPRSIDCTEEVETWLDGSLQRWWV